MRRLRRSLLALRVMLTILLLRVAGRLIPVNASQALCRLALSLCGPLEGIFIARVTPRGTYWTHVDGCDIDGEIDWPKTLHELAAGFDGDERPELRIMQ